MFRPTDRLCLFASLHVSLDIKINISPKSSSNTKLLTSKCFFGFFLDSCPIFPSFLSLCGRSVFFCYLAKVSYYERFSASHKLAVT